MAAVLGPPTLAGYIAFLRNIAGINITVLPDDSIAIPLSYEIAGDIASCQLRVMGADIYTLAIYNLATDRLINFTPDQPGQTFFGGNPNAIPPIKGLRQQYNLNAFVAGVIESSHDEGTGQNIAVPDSLRNLTLLDLQLLKTPFGLAYEQFAQQIGTLWGLTG